jgi:hypothetical protein
MKIVQLLVAKKFFSANRRADEQTGVRGKIMAGGILIHFTSYRYSPDSSVAFERSQDAQ